MPQNAIVDWGTALMTGIAGGVALFMAAIPRIIGALVIFIIGWLIALALASLVTGALRRVGFDQIADRTGFTGFIRRMGFHLDAAKLIGNVVYWFIFLITLGVALQNLDIPALNAVISAFLLWLPNLAIALIVLLIAGLIANAVAGLARGAAAEAGMTNPDFIATIARVAIWAFAIIIAVNQVGIATALVDALFFGFVAATALALGLAFGLGGRETAGLIVRNWYERSQGLAGAQGTHRERPSGPRQAA